MSTFARVSFSVVRFVIRISSMMSAELGARLAYPLFARVGPRLAVSPAHAATHESARKVTAVVRGREVVTYEWGEGERTVLLVHGWRGRASQFSRLVRELRYEGYRVVSFDAPANGDSPGRRTSILDYVATIRMLDERYGGFDTILGHSFGALAAISATAEGVRTGRLIAVAGVSGPDYLCAQFIRIAGLPAEIEPALGKQLLRQVFNDDSTLMARYSALNNPLPGTPLLLIHDEDDAVVSIQQSRLVADAHAPASRLVATRGLGHNRILNSDRLLDEVLDFVRVGPTAEVLAK
ncbi:hydrolase, putative [marine actinobacterium PHSC20C1]|nr:hydrolase, putative [marine actinobacterium PHSC20C1]